MAGGYFTGLWLGFGLIVLGMECYYFILARYIDKELTGLEAVIFISCLIFSIALFIKSFSGYSSILTGIISFFPLPVAYAIMTAIRTSKDKIEQKIDQDRDLNNWLYTIEKEPENVNAYVAAGDIYFKRKDYEKAMKFYQKAEKLIEMPYISEKIKITEKEIKIQKGLVWVCPECSFDNSGETTKCRYCGYSKIDGNLLKDIKNYKRELIKGIYVVVFGPLAVIVSIALYIQLPAYLALIFTLVVIYLTIRFFINY
ncbi:MAG: hypothetical protein NC907_05395 [Candidatus Omnitrophica bacterium]|nr:hypothetical protein [Candidatus Omnitrophota bacterium]